MIRLLARLLLTVGFAGSFYRTAVRSSVESGGDMVILLAYGLCGAMALALLWAPVIGDKLSDPLTSVLTQETSLPQPANTLLQWIGWLQRRGWHRAALACVFIEGLRHPDLPQAAWLGLHSARPGSYLEKCFAREVYGFNNIQHCLAAYRILRDRHGVAPPWHRHPEVNLAVAGLNRVSPPEPARVRVVPFPLPALPARDPRIKLFAE